MGGQAPRTLEQFREHFWGRVDKSGGPGACWPWTRGKQGNGYGIVNARVLGHDPVPTHRVVFWLEHGRWPAAGRHTCDNPPCCNPTHIIEGTQAQNMQDCIARGRFRIGGHTSSTWSTGDTLWDRANKER